MGGLPFQYVSFVPERFARGRASCPLREIFNQLRSTEMCNLLLSEPPQQACLVTGAGRDITRCTLCVYSRSPKPQRAIPRAAEVASVRPAFSRACNRAILNGICAQTMMVRSELHVRSLRKLAS